MKFSQDCELFSAPPLCKGVQGECKKPGYAPPPTGSTGAPPVHQARTESEGEGEGARVRFCSHGFDLHQSDVNFGANYHACVPHFQYISMSCRLHKAECVYARLRRASSLCRTGLQVQGVSMRSKPS